VSVVDVESIGHRFPCNDSCLIRALPESGCTLFKGCYRANCSIVGGPPMGLGTEGAPPVDDKEAEDVLEWDWVLFDIMVVVQETLDMAVLET
jgi:hypothetical protein